MTGGIAMHFINEHYGQVSTVSKDSESITIINKSKVVIGAALYNKTDYGAHIVAIAVLPIVRQHGVGKKIVQLLMKDYNKLTANVLLTEIYNLKFWNGVGFILTESNLPGGYVQVQWTN
jgi:N-acetylglutamate synthase-like GNAT family acetyltransferase